MTFSNITINEVLLYLKLDITQMTTDEQTEIQNILDASKEFVRSQTGLTDSNLDNLADIVVAVCSLCQHCYDNRSYVIEKTSINPLIQAILGAHSINYL